MIARPASPGTARTRSAPSTTWCASSSPGSILYLAVPDKRYTFDADRPVTPTDHVLRDYQEEARRVAPRSLRGMGPRKNEANIVWKAKADQGEAEQRLVLRASTPKPARNTSRRRSNPARPTPARKRRRSDEQAVLEPDALPAALEQRIGIAEIEHRVRPREQAELDDLRADERRRAAPRSSRGCTR